MSHIWRTRYSTDYNKRDYKSILSKYSERDLKEMIYEGVDHIHFKIDGKEIEERLLDEDEYKNALCSVMFSTALSIKCCDISTEAALSSGEFTADILFHNLYNKELQGYLSYYLPMWEFLDWLATRDNPKFEIVNGVLVNYNGDRNDTHVSIPDSVHKIGKEAFMWNTWIENIDIPTSVKKIDKGAFKGCKKLEYVSIPESVTEIGDYAFEYCTSLVSAFVSDGVIDMGSWTFHGCNSLETISLPDSITAIDSGVFAECNSLVSVMLPKNLTHIGEYAFCGCPFQP